MTRHRRSRTDVIADILTVAMEDSLKTLIMYRANLSHTLLKKYLALLQETNLLQTRREDSWVIYTTTEKGREFLQKTKQRKEAEEADSEQNKIANITTR